jgi:chorismate mutase
MTFKVRAIRGATKLAVDTPDEVDSATIEMVTAMLEKNKVKHEDLVSIFFTCTPDIHSRFPAASARELGLGDVPLICAQELAIADALPLTIRAMITFHSDLGLSEVSHVYLRGAEVLRRDIAQ